MADELVKSVEYSEALLADLCNLFRFKVPIEATEQNPMVAFMALNALWGVPAVAGPQSARRPLLAAIGRSVREGGYARNSDFAYAIGSNFGPIQATPFLYDFAHKLMAMSEIELVGTFDKINEFYDTHTGIVRNLSIVGGAAAIRGKSIVESIRNRAAGGGLISDAEAIGEAILERAGLLDLNVRSKALQVGKAFGILGAIVYVATIGEAHDKLDEIRQIAMIRYREGSISENAYRYILDVHPTDELPRRYWE